jgi:predicted enzyme related to lactoylglutathione lyase
VTRNLYLALCIAVAALPAPRTAVSREPTPAPIPIELPPLVQPASGETHPGKVIWADLVTPDLKQAEQFYGALFGWTFEPINGDNNFAIALNAGTPVAGIVQRAMKAGQQRQPAWLTFIAVRDVAAAQRSALANGGKILSPAKDYAQRGRQTVLADPDGAVFAVLASSSGDPPDVLAEPGEWIWSSLLVKNTDHETGFYRALFGYDVFELPPEDAADNSHHVILASDDYARAGIHSLPADSVHRHPHWLNFIRVDDAAAVAVKAIALGGKVLVEPRVDRHGGQLAVIADPSGAPIGVMEWSGAEDAGAAAGDQPDLPGAQKEAP